MHGNNPLEIPELLRRISRYVATNDALACARVCKTWSDHFVSAIWYTVDFDVHKGLRELNTKVLAKHGHHIRVVKNISDLDRILVLINSARKLRRLSFEMTATQEFYACFVDLLRQVNASLQYLEIVQGVVEDEVPYFAVDSLFPVPNAGATSKLSFIRMEGLILTRQSFSLMLKNCPLLRQLTIQDTTLLYWSTHNTTATQLHQHTGLFELTASLEQVFRPNQSSQKSPSLFAHFPKLFSWHTWNSDIAGPIDIPTKEIQEDIAKHCRFMRMVSLETCASVGITILTQAFKGLASIRIITNQLSAEMVMAISDHRETLESILSFVNRDNIYDSEEIPEVESISTGGWIIQSMPRHCNRLQKLQLSLYEMDMDDVERADWGCRNLEELHIRVRGLDTKEKINRAIQLWKEGVNATDMKQVNGGQKESSSTSLQLTPPGDNSIEARVARHLLKFQKLSEVWLGWRLQRVTPKYKTQG
ncbi:MAG: hypothetical protein J3Q66DRAFT_321564 [Benniella sp.]|nr:MAG: hypothetical protein J3Q66DRAFT_321564 [Benniella sp.]